MIAQGKIPTTPCQTIHHPVRVIFTRWPFANANADLGTNADGLATPGPPLRGSSSPLGPAISVTPPPISLELSHPANEVTALECVEPHAVSSPLPVRPLDGIDNHTDAPTRSTSSSPMLLPSLRRAFTLRLPRQHPLYSSTQPHPPSLSIASAPMNSRLLPSSHVSPDRSLKVGRAWRNMQGCATCRIRGKVSLIT